MKRFLPFLITAALAFPSAAAATFSSMPHTQEAKDVSSGGYRNDGAALVKVWGPVRIDASDPDASWIRVHFDQWKITPRDFVRIRSLEDGWTYDVEGRDVYPRIMLAGAVVTYFSLFLNGSAVELELWAQPGSVYEDGGVHVDYIHVGGERLYTPACWADPEDRRDTRVCRVIAWRDIPLFNGDQYLMFSGTLLFPGSCILTAGDPFDNVTPSSNNVIVEFGEPRIPDGAGGFFLRPHAHPDSQFRMNPSKRCLGPVNGETYTFQVKPNEHTGKTPGAQFRDYKFYWFGGPQLAQPALQDCAAPANVVGISVVGQPSISIGENPIEPFLAQSQDLMGRPAGDADRNHIRCSDADGAVVHNSTAAQLGSEGGPLMDDRLVDAAGVIAETSRKIYGIHTEHSCPLGAIAHAGRSFRDPDIDPAAAGSCVKTTCNTRSEYPPITMRNRPVRVDRAESNITLQKPGVNVAFALQGEFGQRDLARHMGGDGLWDVATEMVALDLAGVSCMGPVQVTPRTGSASKGVTQQRDSTGLYPADSFFDVFVDVEIDGQTFRNLAPIHLQAALDDVPGYDDAYQLATPVMLVDGQGNPAWQLQSWTLVLRERHDSFSTSGSFSTSTLGTFPASGASDWTWGSTDWNETAQSWQIPAEIVANDLRGSNTIAGPIIVREFATVASSGTATFPFLADSFPAAVSFDVFYEIELPQMQKTLYNQQPVRLTGTIRDFVPTDDTLRSAGPVTLYDRQTGQPVTTLTDVVVWGQDPLDWTSFPPPGTDAFCASGRAIVNLGQGPVTLDSLLGRSRIQRGPVVEQPDGTDLIQTEMISLDLQSSATPLGAVVVRLLPPPTVGTIHQAQPQFQYPADSFFDVFLEIQTASGRLHNTQPFRIQSQIHSIPPTESYQNQPTQPAVQLFDTTGQPRGYLHYFFVQPGRPYDPTCPMIFCSPVAVGVEPSHPITTVRLHPPIPNPARSSVRLRFDLPRTGGAVVDIYDVAGRWVKRLAEGPFAGPRSVELTWDGSDQDHHPVRAGVYFVRLDADGVRQTRTVILQR